MIERLSRNFEKPALDIIAEFEEVLGEQLLIKDHVDTEYVISSDSIERLVLDIDVRGEKLTIVDIEVRTRERGAGANVVVALVEVAAEHNYQLFAEDVSDALDSWWRDRGFEPIAPGSADYMYKSE